MSRGEPIGEVECSHKGCTEVCKVYAFKPRTPGRRSVFTGKKYFDCPRHGRVGADGSQTVTDYILEVGKIWGANRPDATPEKPAAKPETPAPTPEPKPESTRSEPKPASESTGSGPRRRPASNPNSKTSTKPSRKLPPVEPPKPKPAPDRGWKPLID